VGGAGATRARCVRGCGWRFGWWDGRWSWPRRRSRWPTQPDGVPCGTAARRPLSSVAAAPDADGRGRTVSVAGLLGGRWSLTACALHIVVYGARLLARGPPHGPSHGVGLLSCLVAVWVSVSLFPVVPLARACPAPRRSPLRRMTAATLALLLGFFSATSAATIIGSVADWDPLAAGMSEGVPVSMAPRWWVG